MKQTLGLALMEFVVALCISSLLLAFLIGHFMVCKRQYQRSGQMLADALEVTLVSQLIRDSVRWAGFAPCVGLDHLLLKDRRNRPEALIQAIDLSEDFPHSLSVSGMDNAYVLGLAQKSETALLLSGSCAFEVGQDILIADCIHGEIHRVQAYHKEGSNCLVQLARPTAFAYPHAFYVGAFVKAQFFIAIHKQKGEALFYASPEKEVLTSRIQRLEVALERPWVLVYLQQKDQSLSPIFLKTRMRVP